MAALRYHGLTMRPIYKAPEVIWTGPKVRPPPPRDSEQPANYCSAMPWQVYITLQNKHPQRLSESDKSWVMRVKPMLDAERGTLMIRSTKSFADELRDKALNRGMRRIVAFDEKKQPGMEAKRLLHNGQVINTNPYLQAGGDNKAATGRFEDEMVEWLADMSNTATPHNGAIFWNGINENKLAERVNAWNGTYPPGEVHFGALEATTDVKYVNNKYVWNWGGAYHKYGEKVSEALGAGSTGHVTAVVRFGLAKTSIFTNTELPRMLYNMASQIEGGATPKMTDLTIIVIEPLGATERVRCYTNGEILTAPVWVKNCPAPYPSSVNDCAKLADLGDYIGTEGFCAPAKKVVPASGAFLAYLQGRPTKPSPATPKLLDDIKYIVHDNQPITRA